jgi:catechol 2,3-dioxygenase-like lactoylglutathione lyase family enzyme
MPVLRFAHVNLRAPRALLDELRDFYVQVVGLQVGPRPPLKRFGYWHYAGGEPVLHLSEADPGETFATGLRTTFNHVALDAQGFRSTQARLLERGIVPRVVDDLVQGQRQLFFSDPAGNGVELSFALDDEG